MKYFLALLFVIGFTANAIETNTHQFFDEKLVIELPTQLKPLTKSAMRKRYSQQSTPPAFAFNNKDKNVSFTFTQYTTPADKKSMKRVHNALSSMLRKANSSAQWKKDKVYNRLDTRIAVFEYETSAVGKYQYNLTYALPVNGKLTFISFITTEKKYKSKWLELARQSMDSIQLTSP